MTKQEVFNYKYLLGLHVRHRKEQGISRAKAEAEFHKQMELESKRASVSFLDSAVMHINEAIAKRRGDMSAADVVRVLELSAGILRDRLK